MTYSANLKGYSIPGVYGHAGFDVMRGYGI